MKLRSLLAAGIAAAPALHAQLVINEVDADTPGSDSAEFVELYDGGTGNTALDGYVIVFVNGNGETSYQAFDLDGHTTDANGYFVLGNSGVSGVDLVFGNGDLQNGADAVALYTGSATDFPFGTAVNTTDPVDAIVYGVDDPDDEALRTALGQTTQYNENVNGNKDQNSNSRIPDGNATIQAAPATPGTTNLPPDTTKPVILPPLDPADNATGVPVDQNLSITFDELVQPGIGNIVLMKVSVPFDDPVETFDITTDADFNGATVTVNPTLDLLTSTDYYVLIDDTAIKDLAGNTFAGISVNDAWNFRSADPDTDPPVILSRVPDIDATGVDVNTNLKITFDEDVQTSLFPSPVTIRLASDNSLVESITLDGPKATFIDGEVTLNPDTTLDPSTEYTVQIPFGAIVDKSPLRNAFPGTTWSFETLGALPDIVINELDADQIGTDAAEFVEIYNNDPTPASLDGLVLVLLDGDTNEVYDAIGLSGNTIPASDFFVIGNASVPNVDLVDFPSNDLQNGADAAAIYAGSVGDFSTGTPIASITNTLVDAVVYDTNDPDNTTLLAALTPGQSQINEDDNGNREGHSISRVPDGGTAKDTSTYVAQLPTPGETNILPSNTFAGWLSANGYTSTGFDNDDDSDGDKNGIEWYFFNTSPNAPSGNGSPLSGLTSTGAGTFTFTHLRPVDASEVIVTYEYSLDLGATWNPGDATVTITPGAPTPDVEGYEVVTVTVSVDPPTTPKVFVRVSITEETPM